MSLIVTLATEGNMGSTYLILYEHGDPSRPDQWFAETPAGFGFIDAVSEVARADRTVIAVYRATPGEVLADVSSELASYLTRCTNLSTKGREFVDYCGFVPLAAE